MPASAPVSGQLAPSQLPDARERWRRDHAHQPVGRVQSECPDDRQVFRPRRHFDVAKGPVLRLVTGPWQIRQPARSFASPTAAGHPPHVHHSARKPTHRIGGGGHPGCESAGPDGSGKGPVRAAAGGASGAVSRRQGGRALAGGGRNRLPANGLALMTAGSSALEGHGAASTAWRLRPRPAAESPDLARIVAGTRPAEASEFCCRVR